MTPNAPKPKHPPLARPALGQFARQEWAILGAPCGEIKRLAFALTAALADRHRLAYVDADHASADVPSPEANSARAHGAVLELTDKIGYFRLDWQLPLGTFQQRTLLQAADAVLVNGNHFGAARQIIFLDPRKPLDQKLDRLTDVRLILAPPTAELSPAVAAHLAQQPTPPDRLASDDIVGMAAWLGAQLVAARPPLFGLVLAGGRSQRMGHDKGRIAYHQQMPQRVYVAQQLAAVTDRVFLSCRPDQVADVRADGSPLPDTFADLGPMGAILSAFRAYPDVAWLVVACDLPLLDAATLAHLAQQRDARRVATAFRNSESDFPEPLVAIWEPRSYPVLLQFLGMGYSCPRKVLINSDCLVLEPLRPEALRNVNTPEEMAAVRQRLANAPQTGTPSS